MMNGAVTLGTFDGANVEMCECAGRENMFIFGLSSEEVDNAWKVGYNPKEIYENNPRVKVVIDMLKKGFDGESFKDIADY
jgi:starch phosphorylase